MTDISHWDDEPMDARLRDLAKDYNCPSGMVPRDAMWQAIAPAVRAAQVPDIAPAAATELSPRTARRRRHIAPYAWGAALAAGLVLGIVLEREVLTPHSAVEVAATASRGDTQHVAAVANPSTTVGTATEGTAGIGTTRTDESSSGAASGERGPVPSRRVASADTRSGADRTAGVSASKNPTSDTETGAAAQRLYQLAARQTLVQAEALLTAYRTSDGPQRDQESMQQAGRWARDVLTSTRLLLDSPAANDPQFRALFTDLELVLAQIVQLSGAPLQAGERELIERAMRDRDLLPRLRSAVPAGATAD